MLHHYHLKRQEYNPETSGLPSQQQDMFPDRSGLLSRGLESRSIWMVRGNPDRSGFGSRLIFTVWGEAGVSYQ